MSPKLFLITFFIFNTLVAAETDADDKVTGVQEGRGAGFGTRLQRLDLHGRRRRGSVNIAYSHSDEEIGLDGDHDANAVNPEGEHGGDLNKSLAVLERDNPELYQEIMAEVAQQEEVNKAIQAPTMHSPSLQRLQGLQQKAGLLNTVLAAKLQATAASEKQTKQTLKSRTLKLGAVVIGLLITNIGVPILTSYLKGAASAASGSGS